MGGDKSWEETRCGQWWDRERVQLLHVKHIHVVLPHAALSGFHPGGCCCKPPRTKHSMGQNRSPSQWKIAGWGFGLESRCMEQLQGPSRARKAGRGRCRWHAHHRDVDRLLICRGRGWCRNGTTSHALRNSGHGHYKRETLAISLWLLSAMSLSFAIGSGLLTLDALRAVNVIGVHRLVLFLRSP